MRGEFWNDVKQILVAGKTPRIEVPAACELVEYKGAKRQQNFVVKKKFVYKGRARIVKVDNGRALNGYLLTPYGRPMTCRLRGCQKMLPLRNRWGLACCEDHAKRLVDYCEQTLAVMRGNVHPEDYPMEYRSRRGAGSKTSRSVKIVDGGVMKEKRFGIYDIVQEFGVS